MVQAAAALWLVSLFPGQAFGQDRTQETAGAVVLVVKVLSSTHARLTTGVVLARADESQAVLVVVPAEFVSRGDEILVLDGGTDLLRNGRLTRTVARSAATGIAVLEVDGLSANGVELAANADSGRMQYHAFPAAQALASGASMLRASVELYVSDDGVVSAGSELPAQAGPLLNACGGLAGFVTGAREVSSPPVVTVPAIAELLESAGLEFVVGACGEAPVVEESPVQVGEDSGSEEAPTDAPSKRARSGPITTQDSPRQVAIEPLESDSKTSDALIWAAVLGVGVAGLFLWLRRSPPGLRLERQGARTDASGAPVSVKARGGSAVIRCAGTTVSLETSGERVVISHRITGDGSVAVSLAGTPCLEGEEFLGREGDLLSVGNAIFEIRLGQTR